MHRGDTTHVNDRDRLMALALAFYEDSCCPGCGMPHWVGADFERAEIRERVCQWCSDTSSQVEQLTKAYADNTPPPGVHFYAVDRGDPAYTPLEAPAT